MISNLPRLHFETQPQWLAAVRAWAASVPGVERVWVFGSRASGVRSPKPEAPPVPDLDLAYILTGGEPGESLAQSMFEGEGWRGLLQAAIPVPVDLQMACPDTDQRVWPAVVEHGVLIYTRDGCP